MSLPSQDGQPFILSRIMGIVILIVIILITSILIILGYVINTVFDYNLSINSIYTTLPAAAKAAFGTQVQYTLTTYGFIVGVVVILAISGTIAAIFGLQSRPEDTEDSQF